QSTFNSRNKYGRLTGMLAGSLAAYLGSNSNARCLAVIGLAQRTNRHLDPQKPILRRRARKHPKETERDFLLVWRFQDFESRQPPPFGSNKLRQRADIHRI